MTSYRDRHLAGHYAPKGKPKNTGSSKTKRTASKTTTKK